MTGKGKFDHLLKYMNQDEVGIKPETSSFNDKKKMSSFAKLSHDAFIKSLNEQFGITEQNEMNEKIDHLMKNTKDDKPQSPLKDLTPLNNKIEDFNFLNRPMQSEIHYSHSKPANKNQLKEISSIILGILMVMAAFLYFGILSQYAIGPLELFIPSFWPSIIVTFLIFMYSPLYSILVVIGLFMKSTPPAWIGVLLLMPGIPFLIAGSGFKFFLKIKNKIMN